ncbi:MAG: hypothetical protein SGPRY_011561 [Prymnesium sp.]
MLDEHGAPIHFCKLLLRATMDTCFAWEVPSSGNDPPPTQERVRLVVPWIKRLRETVCEKASRTHLPPILTSKSSSLGARSPAAKLVRGGLEADVDSASAALQISPGGEGLQESEDAEGSSEEA